MRGHLRALAAVGIAVAFSGSGHAQSMFEGEADALTRIELADRISREANQVLGLKRSEVGQIVLPDRLQRSERFSFQFADGERLEFELVPFSIRSDSFEVRLHDADDRYELFDPGPPKTVRGHVVGQPERLIAGTIDQNELRAVILDGNGRRTFIEPAWGRTNAADIDHHVMYEDMDVLDHGGTCVALGEQVRHDPRGEVVVTECFETVCETLVAIDADSDYLQYWGSEEAVVTRIENVMNIVNLQYEADVSIRHVLGTFVIRTQPAYFTNDSIGLLNSFRAKWLVQHRDVERDIAHLFTGKEIDSNVIGIAWLGAICDPDIGFGLSQSDCCGSIAAAADLTAHELGHNWNAGHCNCVGWTMNPFITVGNRFHPEFTVPDIRRFRDGRNCLSAGQPRPTSLPFYDDFEGDTLNLGNWTSVRGAGVDDAGLNEPSGSQSCNLDGMELLTSASLDTSTQMNVTFEYWWQREGLGDAPEEGDDLIVEFKGPDGLGDWRTVHVHPGDGPDIQGFQKFETVLPVAAEHPTFQVRFRTVSTILNQDLQPVSNDGFDDWFIDNVRIDAEPSVPQSFLLSTPLDGAVALPIPLRLDWQSSPRATSYSVHVASSPDMSGTVFRQTTQGTNVTVPASELEPATRYYWRVNATNPRGAFASEIRTFVTTLGMPGTFSMVSPINGAFVNEVRPLLRWSASSDAARYDIVVARDPMFEDVIVRHFQFATDGAETESYLMPGNNLLNNRLFYWKVTASNVAGHREALGGTQIFRTAWSCPGDVSGDGAVDVNDITYVLNRLGEGDDSADANGDGLVSTPDIVFIVFRFGLCL